MAKLNQTEMRAVVDTVMLKIEESSVKSQEQLDYEQKLKIFRDLEKEAKDESKRVVLGLMEKYQKEFPQYKFTHIDYQNYVDIDYPAGLEEPKGLSRNDIERELIVANISGNIHETMEKIINKYTNK
jgi:hypothetical protein